MITLCVPTRGRPERFRTMIESADKTADGPIECIAVLDADDPERGAYRPHPSVTYYVGDRPIIGGVLYTSELWTRAGEQALGDIAMMGADDNIFETQGWDTAVENAFASVPDRIVMVACADGTKRGRPEAPFVSREWIEATGEFAPPGYQGWFSDVWLWSLAAAIERVILLPDVMIRHHQYRRSDDTYRDGETARAAEGGPLEIAARFYGPEQTRRRFQKETKLHSRMTGTEKHVPDPVPDWYTEARHRMRG